MPAIPAALQRKILERWAADVARKVEPPVDPVLALEAVDYAFDATLTYEANKKAIEDELAHRGIFAEAPKPETPEWRRVEELPPYRPPAELKEELEEVKTERERLVKERRNLKPKVERFKELSETERLKLAAEAREIEERLKTVVGEIPPEYIDELKTVFLKLKDATEDKFWDWYGMYRDEIKEKHKVAIPATFEPSMRDFLAGKPRPAPPKPVVPARPEPKFSIGEKAFHPDLKEVTIRAQRWNELLRRWDYVVEARKKTALVAEAELIKLPELPPAPPKVRVPRVLPPKTLEEVAVSPFTKKPLTRFPGPVRIAVEKPITLAESIRRRLAGRPEWEIESGIREEVNLRKERDPMFTNSEAIVGRERVMEDIKIPPGFIVYTQGDKKAPDYGRFYLVEDMKISKGIVYDELVVRLQRFYKRIMPPPPKPPRAPLPFAVTPRLYPPFEVPFADRDVFFGWLTSIPNLMNTFTRSDPEQQRKLFDNWKSMIRGS